MMPVGRFVEIIMEQLSSFRILNGEVHFFVYAHATPTRVDGIQVLLGGANELRFTVLQDEAKTQTRQS